MIVTPDSVLAAIEVKTSLASFQDIHDAVAKLARVEDLANTLRTRDKMWTGLFVYDGGIGLSNDPALLTTIRDACKDRQAKLNCLSYGFTTFVRYWTPNGVEWGQGDDIPDGESWRSYELDQIAPTYFISNLLDSISPIDRPASAYAWFPSPGGKYVQRRWVLRVGEQEPIPHDECERQRRARV